MHTIWGHLLIAAAIVVGGAVIAKLVDMWIARRNLAPEVATRYRVLRRTIVATIAFVGVISALLVIPQVRAVAGGILASSAVLGIVVGLAAQRTLGNFIAGLSIAFTQPVRLGDEIEVGGTEGVVEEIGLTYTWVRTRNDDMLAIPNEKLASETIRNRTIRSRGAVAEVRVQLPLATDIRAAVTALEGDEAEVYLTGLGTNATIAVRRRVARGDDVDRAESDLRLTVHERLRTLGVLQVQA
jgi:small-conductance mechanosensitive channel